LTDAPDPPGPAAGSPTRRQGSKKVGITTIGELLYWSYANLGAATVARKRGLASYDVKCFMVRARLFKGLTEGTLNLGSLFDDVREMARDRCAYCGATPPKLHADHLIPRHRGGPESGDNLVWACPSCNGAKGARDLMEWYAARSALPPLPLAKRYLKLAIHEAVARQIMDVPLDEKPSVAFSIGHVPTEFRQPDGQLAPVATVPEGEPGKR
jgi:hypothetical protein